MRAPDGVFFFESQYLMDIVDKMLLGTIFHEPMSHHALHPMRSPLPPHSFELVGVRPSATGRGHLEGWQRLSWRAFGMMRKP
jgi:hypothetical protein